MSEKASLHLFEGVGIELEYMIVEQASLNVLPAADKVLKEIAGSYENEVTVGELGWSNELALHVIELKTPLPVQDLRGMGSKFHSGIQNINRILKHIGARLMPGPMHPWMNPMREMILWPHENSPIYEAYNRIFDCRGHGWANLQSQHINLPFGNAEEFGRLHAAIRLILPLIPSLAAGSPVIEERIARNKDQRLDVYRFNQKKIPRIAGKIIPEAVFSPEDYQREILLPLYHDISPYDPDGILQEEWLNSRGAIARFERNAIEIRLIDIQECPQADIAIAELIFRTAKALTQERWSTYAEQKAFSENDLAPLLLEGIRDAEAAVIRNTDYLAALGLRVDNATADEVWTHLVESTMNEAEEAEFTEPLGVILRHGTLATRILRAIETDPSRQNLVRVYGTLCDCLDENKMFVPHV